MNLILCVYLRMTMNGKRIGLEESVDNMVFTLLNLYTFLYYAHINFIRSQKVLKEILKLFHHSEAVYCDPNTSRLWIHINLKFFVIVNIISNNKISQNQIYQL